MIAYFKPIPEAFILKKNVNVQMVVGKKKKEQKVQLITLCSRVYLNIRISEKFGGPPLFNCNFW